LDSEAVTDVIDQFLTQAQEGDTLDAKTITKGLNTAREQIYHEFDKGVAVQKLIHDTSQLIDQVLEFCFLHFIGNSNQSNCALVAVGGFGRSELAPGSDIDLMILLDKKASKAQQQVLSTFLTFLWDIGLEVGHSVRTIRDCVREGKADVTVMTNMLESRLIYGNEKLYQKYQLAISPKKMWSSRKFFEANIKEGPGGLRDIQIIGWVAKRHFDAQSFAELVEHGFLTEAEFDLLDAGQQHLWRVRFALHRLAGRREDRLLFDYQKKIAEEFGFKSGEHNLAIEQFMQQYYRTIMELERLSEMLLQIFKEEILLTASQRKIKSINERFRIRTCSNSTPRH
jgi:[protein-PII] uridylyltransferase